MLSAAPQVKSPSPKQLPTLVERFPPPPGYSVEQDVESEGARSFSTASDVRGHILRRFVQAGDDGPTSVPEIVRYFADLLHEQNGFMFDDRLNNVSGRLDGRIPGPRPVWLHVEINDSGSVLDITALEEPTAAPSRDMPVEEWRIAGSWSAGDSATAIAAVLAPAFRPYQGWAWSVVPGDTPSQSRVTGFQRSQACATCAIVTAADRVVLLNVHINDSSLVPSGFAMTGSVTKFRDGGRILIAQPGLSSADFEAARARAAAHFAVIDLPWKYAVGEVSLYQYDLVDAFLATAALMDLVK
jgi:hypothetical protein